VERSIGAVLKKESADGVSLEVLSIFFPYLYLRSSNSSFLEGIIVFFNEL
jgi:hypothetical protein